MKGYELVEDEFEYGINFYFVSSGKRNVMKMIGIENFMTYESKEVYNLGFGDYDFKRLSFDDSSRTENSDGRMVFNTVLCAIRRFFELYPYDMMIIRGSDSTPQFKSNCKKYCKRKCDKFCRKFNQRIRIYRNYLEKHYDVLCKEYEFSGAYGMGLLIEPYKQGKNYTSIIITKRIKLSEL